MIAESIQNTFWWIEDEISFHFIVKSKFEHLKKNKNNILNLITVHFKIWSFNT